MVSLDLNGKRTITLQGQSVFATMLAAGETPRRQGESGSVHGPYCGMGVCQECLVSIDGSARRSCLTIVEEGARIEPLDPRRHLLEPNAATEFVRLTPDLLVVGGGAAGLSAAAVAAEHGLDVVLVDERAKLGGQFFKQPARDHGFRIAGDRQYEGGAELISRVKKSGAKVLENFTVLAAFPDGTFFGAGKSLRALFSPTFVVLATGAYERPALIPGWTLPGSLSTGAVQTLLRSYATPPGKRILVAGNGPLNLQVACELVRAGVDVVGLVETASNPLPRAVKSVVRMAFSAPGLVLGGVKYNSQLARAGVPVFRGHAPVRIHGTEKVDAVTIARLDAQGQPQQGTERDFEVDTVCTGFGFIPSNEIARTLGCDHVYDETHGHLRAVKSSSCRSSNPKVWIAGDCGGLGGAKIAEAEGTLAGADIVGVAREGKVSPSLRATQEDARRAKQRAQIFQQALWRLYAAPRLVEQLATGDTIVCRCENIRYSQMAELLDSGVVDAGSLKRSSRAGMGRCQGRYCGYFAVEMHARREQRQIDERAYLAPRIPFRPAQLAELDIGDTDIQT